MSRILGIDLGTTNSVMAVMEKNGPFVVPNSLGERITPSVVGFSKSGDILVGKKAKRGAIMNVGRTVFSVKRHMGTSYRVRIEGKEYTPQEISAMILQKLKQDAEDYFGEEIVQSVITVPAYFTDTQRQATKDAGEIAGLNVRRIIDEPTAAALAYGLDRIEDQRLMVYDLGGGTFDVSIIEVISGVFQVQAISGNTHLGGDDFDKRIAEHLVAEFKTKHHVDLSTDPIAMQRLREAAEEAKIELSELKETHVLVEAITMTEKGPLTMDTVLSRDKFEDLCRDLFEATIEPMEKAVRDAKITINELDNILLVGGSTRIPSVQRLVREFTGRNASRDISPEEVVAMGAAVQTMVLAPLEGDLEDTLATRYGREKPVIIHMTPFSLGVGLQGDQFSAIIERNSTYPTEGKDIFTTTRDFQEAISFPIYEGEETTASENTFLDLLRIEGITPAPKGVPRIEVTFRLNPDRILEVTAEDLATGVSKKVVISATDNRLNDDSKTRMIKDAKERVSQMLRSKIKESRQEEARNMMERAEATLMAAGDHPLARDLQRRATDLKASIESGDESNLDETIDDMLRILAEIEASA
ncbi:molecular chaperone DnaK [Candidatus Poribacteria bacterium]|nr:molecular chaperone DnaK [Candidatus Poribacteria bacterium]